MRGKVYCVGVGPGDPELMTLKAAHVLRAADAIAVPVKAPDDNPAESLSYKIAMQAVPEISFKRLVPIEMPMTRDALRLEDAHRVGADALAALLDDGLDIAFLTIGDPTIYSTFSYLQPLLEEQGHQSVLISGVPSFCAAAACAGIPLVLGDEQLRMIPANKLSADELIGELSRSGTCVFMKAARNLTAIKEAVRASGREAVMVENCGLEDERVFTGIDELPDDAGYFSLIIIA